LGLGRSFTGSPSSRDIERLGSYPPVLVSAMWKELSAHVLYQGIEGPQKRIDGNLDRIGLKLTKAKLHERHRTGTQNE
jgi:hypothetical protein